MYPGKTAEWFAVYVKARHEKNVALTLKGKEFEVFLPTCAKTHANRKKFEVPLFPGYVFCRIPVGRVLPVMTVPGVFAIVGTGRHPEPIPESEIDSLQLMLDAGWKAYPWPYVAAGQQVQFEAGPLRGLQGSVAAASNSKWLVVSIHLLQRSVAVKMDRESHPLGAISPRPPVRDGGILASRGRRAARVGIRRTDIERSFPCPA